MSRTIHFTYRSADKVTDIHAIEWQPDQAVIGVVQIVHGMQEFIDRYDDFARFLNTHGFVVVGNDHLGHGASVSNEQNYGYFAARNGNKALLSDMRQLQRKTTENYPDLPYIMLGLSMGSFLARQYACLYSRFLDGLILSGTAFHPAFETIAGKLLCRVMAHFKGWHYRSPFVTKIVMGSFNKKFEPVRTRVDWLTRDEKVVDAYRNDFRTHHTFTLNAYYNMFENLRYLTQQSNLERMNAALPVLLISGAADPVGNYGDGPKRVAAQFKALGMKDVTCKIYPNDRHEVLNELNKKEVCDDVWNWIVDRFE